MSFDLFLPRHGAKSRMSISEEIICPKTLISLKKCNKEEARKLTDDGRRTEKRNIKRMKHVKEREAFLLERGEISEIFDITATRTRSHQHRDAQIYLESYFIAISFVSKKIKQLRYFPQPHLFVQASLKTRTFVIHLTTKASKCTSSLGHSIGVPIGARDADQEKSQDFRATESGIRKERRKNSGERDSNVVYAKKRLYITLAAFQTLPRSLFKLIRNENLSHLLLVNNYISQSIVLAQENSALFENSLNLVRCVFFRHSLAKHVTALSEVFHFIPSKKKCFSL
ncbi:hypothetical protein EAG_06373 [Camponotus floridanus]|uniref:Uncharacterized protein n=1 Tax=Camponotus floridanus TaxID=104421 RepID=E2A2C1_CAMFO|nr:hypothetical protein EAG_06373 [Camponotus floridanus]